MVSTPENEAITSMKLNEEETEGTIIIQPAKNGKSQEEPSAAMHNYHDGAKSRSTSELLSDERRSPEEESLSRRNSQDGEKYQLTVKLPSGVKPEEELSAMHHDQDTGKTQPIVELSSDENGKPEEEPATRNDQDSEKTQPIIQLPSGEHGKPEDEPPSTKNEGFDDSKLQTTMELNVAYEAFEKMRRLNLELECSEAGIVFTNDNPIDHTDCTRCLVICGQTHIESNNNNISKPGNTSNKPLLWLHKIRKDSKEFLHESKKSLKKKTRKAQPPCLLCGSPTCANHSSKAFRKEKIILCNVCVESLDFDFDQEYLQSTELRHHVEHLVDLYDRSLLLLKYCEQFMIDTASKLEQTTKRSNEVGVGSSSAGLVSGALGVAAACTILTPAGPPLLIASLVFGGSATAVSAGSGAYEYFSEPHRLADRILALRGIVMTILQKIRSMREKTLMPYLNQAVMALTSEKYEDSTKKVEKAVTTCVLVSSTAATAGVGVTLGIVAAEEGALASRFMTRATTGLARSARFAQIAGGALSAACIVMEARELTKTISQIRQGHPCEKATELRKIHERISENRLPPTPTIDATCQSYIKVKTKQLAAQRLVREQNKLETDGDYNDLALVEEVVSSLEAAQEIETTKRDVSRTVIRPKIRLSKSVLLERVQRYKEKEANQAEAEVNLIV